MKRFGMSLVLVARLYRRELDGDLKEFGLSKALVLPLRLLARIDRDCLEGELAEISSLEAPTLMRVLDQMLERGLVERIEDAADRRAKIARLTTPGRFLNDKLRQALEPVRRPLSKVLRPLSSKRQ